MEAGPTNFILADIDYLSLCFHPSEVRKPGCFPCLDSTFLRQQVVCPTASSGVLSQVKLYFVFKKFPQVSYPLGSDKSHFSCKCYILHKTSVAKPGLVTSQPMPAVSHVCIPQFLPYTKILSQISSFCLKSSPE